MESEPKFQFRTLGLRQRAIGCHGSGPRSLAAPRRVTRRASSLPHRTHAAHMSLTLIREGGYRRPPVSRAGMQRRIAAISLFEPVGSDPASPKEKSWPRDQAVVWRVRLPASGGVAPCGSQCGIFPQRLSICADHEPRPTPHPDVWGARTSALLPLRALVCRGRYRVHRFRIRLVLLGTGRLLGHPPGIRRMDGHNRGDGGRLLRPTGGGVRSLSSAIRRVGRLADRVTAWEEPE